MAAEATLQSNIDAEASARASADSALDSRVTTLEGDVFKKDGSVVATGDFDLGGNKLTNVATPVDAGDAATKEYVDNATSGMIITREVPTGTLDGSNTSFVLANTPNIGSEQVFINGTLLNVGGANDYTISGDTITFAVAPLSDDVVLVNYLVDGVVLNADVQASLSSLQSADNALDARITSLEAGSSFSGSYNDLTDTPTIYMPAKDVFTSLVDGIETEFTLSNSPSIVGVEQVFLNGMLQSSGVGEDYTISGTTITFNTAPEAGWKLVVHYFV